jgi:hypothetical protein
MILAPLLVSSLLLAAPPAGGIEQAGNASIQTEAHGSDLAQKASTKALAIFRRKGFDTQSTDPDALLSISSDEAGTTLVGAIVIRKPVKWAAATVSNQGRDCFQGRLAAKLSDTFKDRREGVLVDIVVMPGASVDAAASKMADALLAKLAEAK